MASVKNKNTKPELLVRKFLFSKGFRYKLLRKDFTGKHVILFNKQNNDIVVENTSLVEQFAKQRNDEIVTLNIFDSNPDMY